MCVVIKSDGVDDDWEKVLKLDDDYGLFSVPWVTKQHNNLQSGLSHGVSVWKG